MMYRNPRVIIRHLFTQEFPDCDLDKLDKILSKYTDEEVDRVADAVMRFGLAAVFDVVDEIRPIRE